MKPARFLLAGSVVALSLIPAAAQAIPSVLNFGSVTAIDGPNDLIFNNGTKVVYAIDAAPVGVNNVVNGVTFNRSGTTGAVTAVPGYSTSFVQAPFGWSSYAFTDGAAADNAALNNIFTNISCCSGTGAPHQYNLAVPSGTYKLMLLWGENGNSEGGRNWDIEVEGALAVDQIYSNGLVPASNIIPNFAGNNMGVVYSHTLNVNDGALNFRLGQIGGLPFAGGDNNYVLSAIVVLAVIPEPATLLTGLVAAAGLLGMRRRPTRR